MKRKVPKTGNVPSKKSKSTSNGDQTLSEGVKQFEEQEQKEFSGRFNAKLFRKKLNENDFISGKPLTRQFFYNLVITVSFQTTTTSCRMQRPTLKSSLNTWRPAASPMRSFRVWRRLTATVWLT